MNSRMLLIAFDSSQQALRAEMLLEDANIEIDSCPIPKSITAGCALAIQFPEECLHDVQKLIEEERVEIKGSPPVAKYEYVNPFAMQKLFFTDRSHYVIMMTGGEWNGQKQGV